MSSYHCIFIQPGRPVDKVAGDVSVACGARLLPCVGDIDYTASVGHAVVDFERSHEYEDDFGIPFQSYESVITVRDVDRDLERQELTAAAIFRNLAALGTYSLALVFDLQRLVDSATPRTPD